ncbi:hypothetical protein [Microbulbifer epialgicus]|uniref:Phage protein n=1 Tax=Microbulbifer epialgicus TaxID=393907 RepID=A0ABV4NUD2_9GAMM
MQATKVTGTGYVATSEIDTEEQIAFYGEGETAKKALEVFQTSGEFKDYCDCNSVNDGEEVEVRIYKAIYKDDPEWNEEEFNEDFDWVVGECVDTKQLTYYK